MISIEKPPFYWEAREYCEKHELDYAQLENVRQGMAFGEYTRQMHPHIASVARLKSMLPLGEELNPMLMQTLRQLQESTARRLHLAPFEPL